jgi:hypothetical protein
MNWFLRLLIILASSLPTATGLAAPQLSFSDITEQAGVGGPAEPGRTGGHGVMFADVDNDGLPDLYITMIYQEPMSERFYRNLGGGRFREEAAVRRIQDLDGGSHGACFADLNNNGHYDLFNGATVDFPPHFANNRIYQNDGRGFFADVTEKSGLPLDRRWGTRAVLAIDIDGNGWLDLFCVTGYQGSERPPEDRNEVYRNLGQMKFRDWELETLLRAPCAQGAVDTDYNGDGRIDILSANRTGPVNILQNLGQGQFTVVPPESLGIQHRADDGISTSDVNNDGHMDLLLTSADQGHLYLNQGDGKFRHQQSFENTRGYMGAFGDLNLDGYLDLVFAGDDKVYINDGHGKFIAGPAVELGRIDDPRGLAMADIDGDGDLDFAIACKRSTNRMVQNDLSGEGHWLKIRLLSPHGQAGAFGARVWVYPAGQLPPQNQHPGPGLLAMREARSNQGYLGQDDPVLHLGLAEHDTVDIAIRYTDGTKKQFTNIATNQTVLLSGNSRSVEN